MAGMDTASQEFPGLPKHDSASPFEDPAFQNLMAMVAANNPAEAGAGQASAPPSKDAKPKRKAGTEASWWGRVVAVVGEPWECVGLLAAARAGAGVQRPGSG